MASLYIGVYKALYEYTAQAEEELNIQPDDLLYLLERSDVDEWWKVKKRVLPVGDEEVHEPVGLIPSNYIEQVRFQLPWHPQLNTNIFRHQLSRPVEHCMITTSKQRRSFHSKRGTSSMFSI